MTKTFSNMLKKLGIFSKQDGPPDLDEVLKDLGRKIDNIFKRKPRIVVDNNGGGSNNGGNKQNLNGGDIPLLPILLIVFLIWLLTGFLHC